MALETWLLIFTLLAGFYMAWSIGANDVANAMGTSVGSGALTLRQAVVVAAILEFSGAFFFGSHVSETLQSGIIRGEIFSDAPLQLVYGMLAALIATGGWLQLASWFGWPVSTTHAIVGGVVGFGVIVGGMEAIYWNNVTYIVTSWVLSPLFGGLLSYLIFMALRKHVLYTDNPVAAAKRITPILVFIVFSTLSLIMIFKGLQNVELHWSMLQAFVFSMVFGGIASLLSFFCVRRIKEPAILHRVHPYGADMRGELDKARKHLQQVQALARGEVRYETTELIGTIEDLVDSFKEREGAREMSQEYNLVEKIFGYLQIMSACLMAFSHGANDVANAIGPLSAAIYVLKTGEISAITPVPTWTLALGGFGIVVGLATWGWRVIETIGKRITELTPTRGFAAEFGAAATILIASRLGMPISTTHTLVGSVIGVGMARGIQALDLTTTRDIVLSWIITIPISAAATVIVFYLLHSLFGS